MLAPFNKLPPKPEYIDKIKASLHSNGSQTERELVASTGLTKTQALCALDVLISEGTVLRASNKQFELSSDYINKITK
jgi:hypothetical protein